MSLIKFSKKKLSISKKGRSDQNSSSLFFPHAPRSDELKWACVKGNNSVFPKNSRFLFHVLSLVKKINICIYFKEVYSIKQIITVSRTSESCQRVHTAAHNPERATPTLGLCHGVFTDRFIFRHILGQFYTRKWNIHHSMNAVKVNKKVKN